jgi:hypothetical protein
MHLPSYFALMATGVLFGAMRSIERWVTNQLLFHVQVLVILVTLVRNVATRKTLK